MTTDTTAAPARTVLHPTTGQVINLDDLDLAGVAEHVAELDDLVLELLDLREQFTREGSRLLDRLNERTHKGIPGFKLTTNAPQTESYDVDKTREALQALVDADVLDAAVLETVIETAEPYTVTPDPKLRKAEINKLKKHPNPAVAKALGAVRVLEPQKRTFKVERLPS